ncbi:uncharacterized protein B0H18DRAFT_960801 [Fomitopsis serialis]|uniref:uncharacterized protein n=1 Tax=Fomitopsis serialis TaxID=139415 RepID=UPI00200845C9|nr:uncharacterized protein B0H18DRAFT_960801 [Neoantrodia serialis]KAH9912745.1 hypothetical protein B0H18DRAFT_960801 [Neoantrodia serialis]
MTYQMLTTAFTLHPSCWRWVHEHVSFAVASRPEGLGFTGKAHAFGSEDDFVRAVERGSIKKGEKTGVVLRYLGPKVEDDKHSSVRMTAKRSWEAFDSRDAYCVSTIVAKENSILDNGSTLEVHRCWFS